MKIIDFAIRSLTVALLFILIAVLLLPLLLVHFDSLPTEFVDVSGQEAISDLKLPSLGEIPASEIQRASGRWYSMIDYGVGWYQFAMSPEHAKNWEEELHAKLETGMKVDRLTDLVEGVHRADVGNPPTKTIHGTAPSWWNPPTQGFRATQRMRWGNGACYGDEIYSTYDSETKSLWVFDTSVQHNSLWERGNVPAGNQFVLRRQELGASGRKW